MFACSCFFCHCRHASMQTHRRSMAERRIPKPRIERGILGHLFNKDIFPTAAHGLVPRAAKRTLLPRERTGKEWRFV